MWRVRTVQDIAKLQSWRPAAERVLSHLTANRDRYLARFDSAQVEWAIQYARLVQQEISGLPGGVPRDSTMALTVSWIAWQRPGAKVVLWAHNGHIARLASRWESTWRASMATRIGHSASHSVGAAIQPPALGGGKPELPGDRGAAGIGRIGVPGGQAADLRPRPASGSRRPRWQVAARPPRFPAIGAGQSTINSSPTVSPRNSTS